MDEAQRALAEMAKDALPDGLQAEFTASVEDEEGAQISRASPIFSAQRRDQITAEAQEADSAGAVVGGKLGGEV